MKRKVFITLLVPLLLSGCNQANNSSSASMIVLYPVVVDGCPVKSKETLESKIEGSIYQRMTSDHCGLVHAYIDEKDLTEDSITAYVCYDNNNEFIIADYLINCVAKTSVEQPTRHNWGYTASGQHHIKVGERNIFFETNCENEPIVYADEKIYTIEEAYDECIINDDYIDQHIISRKGIEPGSIVLYFSFPNKTYFYNF